MAAPGIDHEGSGAIQYLRSDVLGERREIRLLEPAWRPYDISATRISISQTIEVSTKRHTTQYDFEARSNFQDIRTSIRTLTATVASTDVAMIEEAISRMNHTKSQNIDDWAANLSSDISSHRD